MREAIVWLESACEVTCRMCGHHGPAALIAEINALAVTDLPVIRCPQCRSLEITDDPRESSPDDQSIDGYAEAGASIETIAHCLEAVDSRSVRRFLDVGCNYGFSLDLGRFLYDWEVVGVEPSLAGDRGRDELAVDIRREYLTESSDVGGLFDLILASEVLEHVTDPASFLRLLAGHLQDNGTLVLTTPAAEIVDPAEADNDVLAALSPGYHVFLASRDALESLLRSVGFEAVRVDRRRGALRAVASRAPRVLDSDTFNDGFRPDHLLPYYDSRASTAPTGSALASGMATRHLRTLVNLGRFDEATASARRVQSVFATRHDLDLARPGDALEAIRRRRSAPWNLAGSAFAMGMTSLLDGDAPRQAADYFELTAAAVGIWAGIGNVVDLDSAEIYFEARLHRALALAQFAPDEAAQAALAITEYSPSEHESTRSAIARCRVFVDLVARGHYDAAVRLQPVASERARSLASSEEDASRITGLDSVYSLGILTMVRGQQDKALAWFEACAEIGAARPAADAHAANLRKVAQEHLVLLRQESVRSPVDTPTLVTQERPVVHHGIDVYWCDASGTFLEGWAHAEGHPIQRITVEIGDRRRAVDVHPRPDLADFWPQYPDVVQSGFRVYVPGSPHGTVTLVLHGANDEFRIALDLPPGPLPALDECSDTDVIEQIRPFVSSAPPGPVVTVGMRTASEENLARLLDPYRGRFIVNVDIHPGLGVDVVGDAHCLSRFLAHDSFAIAASASLLEHVWAPWLVASEFARVLKPGGLAIHCVPWVFPTHASPNDFWRFSPEGLASLFGPETGFEVVASGLSGAVVVTPSTSWRTRALAMPTTASGSESWIVARKVRDRHQEIHWPYESRSGARRARLYPESGLAPKFGGSQ